MNGDWRAPLAALLTLVATATAILPATASAFTGPWTDETGDKAPASGRFILRLQKGEATILAAKQLSETLAALKPPPDSRLGQAVLKIEQDNAAFRYREAIRKQQVDLLEVATQPDISDAVILDAPADLLP